MSAKEIQYKYEYGIVTRIVDGDGIYVTNLINGKGTGKFDFWE
jgi:hypothetical protein